MSPGSERPDSGAQMEPLTLGEYQRILAVLRRDAVLRMRERHRISTLRSSLQEEGEDVRCSQCETSTSGRKCSVCVRRREQQLQSDNWFYRHIQSRFSRNANRSENNSAHDNGTAMEPESAQVREFIERLVEALVSGQLDDVKLNRMYTHPEYDRMFACHHSALCENLVQLSFALQMAIMNKPLPVEETPSAVHAALKQRVQRVIQEAMTLPNLKSQVPAQNGSAVHKWDDDITSMTYEDILATAILNKVIEQFQQRTGIVVRDTVDGNQNLPAASSMERAQTYISQVEIGVNNRDDCDTSSLEGLRSWSESSHTEPLSMTIEQCIEEEMTTYDSAGEENEDRSSDGIATTSSELDFYLSGLNFIKHRRVPFPELGVDIVDGGKAEPYSEEDELSDSSQPTDRISSVDSWEENWLFQRRRLKAGGTADSARRSPMPVPMLVPNPSEEFRARIGDRDAEEVSDLSDCSDGALEDVVLAGLETNMTDDCLPKVSVTSQSHDVTPEPPKAESIAAMAIEESIEAEVTSASTNLAKAPSVECLSEFGQQDSEYTEDYASVTQRPIGSLPEQIAPTTVPVPKPRTLPVSSQPDTSPHQELPEDAKQDTELSVPPRPGTDQSDANCTLQYAGTIAEREHRKWESAPPILNNPYSPENINKRLSRQSAGFSSRSSSVTSNDFPELKAARTPSPVQVICTSGEPDYKRYGRDYYINHAKSASGKRCSSSTVTSPFVQQKCINFTNKETDAVQILRLETHVDEIAESHGHVESEIAKWQKEIDQTEQQWLKKLQRGSSAESATTEKLQQNGSLQSSATGKLQHSGSVESATTGKLQHSGSVESATTGKLQQNGSLQSSATGKLQHSDSVESATTGKLQHSGSVESATTGKLQQNGSLQSSATGKLQHSGSVESATTGKLQHSGSVESATTGKLQQNGSLQSLATGKLQHSGSVELATTGKLQHSGSVESATTGKLQQNGSLQSSATGKLQHSGSVESATTGKLQQNGSVRSATTGKPPSARQRMRQLVSDVHDGSSCEQEGKPFKNNVQAVKGKVIEVHEWSNSGYMTPSECSTVSSDLDFDTDVPVVLPSVKELAKQFSGSTTSDSDSSVTKPLPETRHSKMLEVTKEVVIMAREKQQQQKQQAMREVHSLTARSISKEFRDGLRRNLPSHLDRNLHTTGNSTHSNGARNLSRVSTDSLVAVKNGDIKVPPVNESKEFEGATSVSAAEGDRGLTGHKGGRLKDVTEGDHYDSYVRGDGSIPGYTSDESGTQSPSPPLGRRFKLQNSIEFWERLQHSGK